MKLYGMSQSRSFRVLWALEEAKLEYDYIAMNFASEAENGTRNPSYLSLNSQGKVPTLVDQDLILRESGSAVNYIAAKNPSLNLMPEDTKLRARYDEVCFFVLTELEQPLWTTGKHRFAIPEEHRIPDIFPTALWEFDKAMDALSKLIEPSGYAVGDQFTMADVLLAHTLGWAKSFKFEVPEAMLAYRQRMYERDAAQAALAKIG